MKMTHTRFQDLQAHIQAFLTSRNLSEDEVTEHYHARGLSPKRARWDVLYASKYPAGVCYDEGLNDDHIDTALRRIMHHPTH